jgi:hypothetical protein
MKMTVRQLRQKLFEIDEKDFDKEIYVVSQDGGPDLPVTTVKKGTMPKRIEFGGVIEETAFFIE